eukprot:670214-Pleurochrysis_carterae.AAC.1
MQRGWRLGVVLVAAGPLVRVHTRCHWAGRSQVLSRRGLTRRPARGRALPHKSALCGTPCLPAQGRRGARPRR